MYNFFKVIGEILSGIFHSLFGSDFMPYGTGAILNSVDSRDISVATVQSPVAHPDTFQTDISMFPTKNQQDKGTCVEQSMTMLRQYYWYKKTGKVVDLSARSFAIQVKKIDGVEGQGTMPRTAAGVLCNVGIAESLVVPDNNSLAWTDYLNFPTASWVSANASQYKLGGYVSVPANLEAVKQAIFQNGVVTGTLGVDTDWFSGLIHKVVVLLGLHHTLWYGFDLDGIYGKNSWGDSWIGKLLGALGFTAGEFYFKWADYQNDVYDIIAFTDIPQPIIDNAKAQKFYFQNPLEFGETHPDVFQLQKRMDEEGFLDRVAVPQYTNYYGVQTAKAVLAYQMAHKLSTPANLQQYQGHYCSTQTLFALNGSLGVSLVDALIHIESQANDYAIGDLGLKDHAYGCLQIRQGVVDQVNAKLGTSYKSSDCLGNRALSITIFTTYWTIFTGLTTDEDKAKAWNGGPGWKQYYGKAGYETYTKDLDIYWSKVKPLLKTDSSN